MKSISRFLIAIAILAVISSCAEKKTEIKPVRIGDINDIDKTTIGDINLKTVKEVDLVEKLAKARADYKRLLVLLNHWYLDNGYYEKAQWAAKEYADLKLVRTYPYLVEIEIQKTDIKPTDSIASADKLYEEALKLYHEGQILPLVNDKKKLKEALDKFIMLIKKYPNSDKIDDAAFYAAEILKEYFNDDIQAVKYYELAMKWDPHTPHPVRFQCAVIYDFRLHNREKALEMYKRVLAEEPDIDRTNTSFATTRIKQLLKEQQAEESLKSSSVSPKTKDKK